MKLRLVLVMVAVGSWASGVCAKEAANKPYVGSSAPALAPEEAQKRFVVPKGFEVRLFAAEPDVINPVAMCFDEKGRLWVVELYEYPNGAKPGTIGRDRVKVLEDTDGDGRADKVTVFCEGLSLATAIQVGNGGVYVGQAPDLYFYPIVSDGPGGPKAGRRETLLSGFGMEDRHELLNSFCWGPDGWLYLTHGVFTHSLVRDPSNPNDPGVKMDAAVARYNTRTRKFEVFSDGISNQWGVDWDRAGNAFCSACVVEHIWHVVPGGVYVRQGGVPTIPYAYDLLKSINRDKHRHYMAAYGGIDVYQGDLFPEEYHGTVFMGNIHGNCLDHDRLTAEGSSFAASDMRGKEERGEWLEANDDWFRPVSEQTGPDGALWVMDWYDKYPCYQNSQAPDLDRSRGRIWRVVYVGDEKGKAVPPHAKGMDLGKMSDGELVGLLSHSNIWQRRKAQQILSERGAKVGDQLKELVRHGKTPEARLFGLWTLYSTGSLDAAGLEEFAGHADGPVRAWTARLTGESGDAAGVGRLVRLAGDKDAQVRSFVAYAARLLGSSTDTMPVIVKLLDQPGAGADEVMAFLIWRALEPMAAKDPRGVLAAVAKEGTDATAAAEMARRTMRRVCDSKDTKLLGEAVGYLQSMTAGPIVAAALDGLIEGQKGNILKPEGDPGALLAGLLASKDSAVAQRAQRVAALWGQVRAAEAMLRVVADDNAKEAERLAAIGTARQLESEMTRQALIKAASGKGSDAVKVEAVKALGQVGGEGVGDALVKAYPAMGPEARRAAVEVMASRPAWAIAMLSAVRDKKISLNDISPTALRVMSNTRDKQLRALVEATVGKYRESSEEKAQLIAAKKQMVLNGPVDLAAGKQVFVKTCQVCHTLHGEGANVGPDLTGVGRSSFDALLANVIDPNQIIGAGYENTIVETKDNRMVTGRLVESTEDHVKLLSAGPKEDVVARKDIKSARTEKLSVMPEGLEKMPDADFRNLIWYVFDPPQDVAQQRLRIEMGDGKLTVRGKVPGGGEMVELVTYQMKAGERPYLHPVMDPRGEVALTEDGPKDYPWQHGVFTGLHEVNGLDFWSEKGGAKQRFVRLVDVQQTVERVGWRALCEWVGPDGKAVLEEEQAVTVYPVESAEHYRVDFDWVLRSKDQTVKVGKYDFGGFAVRMRSMPGHIYLNSNGERDMAGANKAAKWCDVTNAYDGRGYGIAVLDHPQNLGYPSRWRLDKQGLINPCPSMSEDWEIPAGGERAFHYRMVVHRGGPDVGMLEDEQARFAAVKFEGEEAAKAEVKTEAKNTGKGGKKKGVVR